MIVVAHPAELRRSSNTARLLQAMVPKVELRAPKDALEFNLATERPRLLYPAPGARTLSAELAHIEDPRPLSLVLPDGSWPQARRLAKRAPALAGVQPLCLPPGGVSQYSLRAASPEPGRLCTLEAVAVALGIIEGDLVERALLGGLASFVEATLRARGQAGVKAQGLA